MHIARSLLLTLAAFAVNPAFAQVESPQPFGDWLVHYNALSSQHLPPEMAKRYQIERSSKRGLITVVVQKRDDAGTPVAATITGKASNLTGLESPIRIREIREGEDISYVGEFAVKGPDTYRFTLSITPAGATRAYTLKFEQNYAAN